MRIIQACLLTILATLLAGAAPQAGAEQVSKNSEWLAIALDSGGGPQRALVVCRDPSSNPLAEIDRLRGDAEREQKFAELPSIYAALKARAALASVAGVTLVEDYANLPMAVYTISNRTALTAIVQNPLVETIQPLEKRQAQATANLELIGQPLAALLHQVGTSTAIAVLDTGTDYTRPEFGSCTSPGQPASCKVVYYAHVAPDDGQLDSNGHGTNVAAIVMGVAPDTRIISLNVFNGSMADDQDIIRGLSWVIANYALYHIVAANLSLGGNPSSVPCQSQYVVPFQHLLAARVIPVASSGNDADPTRIRTPACTPGAVSVGAVYDANYGSQSWVNCTDQTTKADQIACFSNSAPFLSMLAPGAIIQAGGHALSGTSQAAPHVSGAIALIRSAAPNASVAQVENALKSSDIKIRDPRNGVVTPRVDLAQSLSPFIPGGIDFDQISYSASGDQGSVTIHLVRKYGHTGTLSIRYQTLDGSAKHNVDYKPAQGVVTWQDGDTAPKRIDITLISNPNPSCGTSFSVQIAANTAETAVLRPSVNVSIGDPNTQSELQLVQRVPDVEHGAATVNIESLAAGTTFLFTAGGHRISSFTIDTTSGKLSNGTFVDVDVFMSPLSKIILISRGSTVYVDGGGPMPLVADIQEGGHLFVHRRLNPPLGVSYRSIAADPSDRFLYATTSDSKLAVFDISDGDPRFIRSDEFSPGGGFRVISDMAVSSDGRTLVADAMIGNEFLLITFARDIDTGLLTKIEEFHFPNGVGNNAFGRLGYDNGPFWYHGLGNMLYVLRLGDDHRFSIVETQTVDFAGSIAVSRDLARVVLVDAQGFVSYKINRESGKLTRVLGEFNITKCLVGAPSARPVSVQFYSLGGSFTEILFGSWKNPTFADGGEIGVFNLPAAP